MLQSFLNIFLPPAQGFAASDGTLYPNAGLALLHDLVELQWNRFLPLLQDGEAVLQTRRELRLSQSELARAAGISHSLLSLIESGQRRMTEPVMRNLWGTLWRLDKAYKTPPALEMLIRLEQTPDGGAVGIATQAVNMPTLELPKVEAKSEPKKQRIPTWDADERRNAERQGYPVWIRSSDNGGDNK